MSNANQLRAFTEVTTIHAWQESNDGGKTLKIYADVSFRTVGVGAEPEIPVRFKLSLKRAKINLILPRSDPALVFEKKELARSEKGMDPSPIKTTREKLSRRKKFAELTSSIVAKFGGLLDAGISSKISHEVEKESKVVTETTEEQFKMRVSGNIISDSVAAWHVEAQSSDRLAHSPWDASTPRATIRDTAFEGRRDGVEAGGISFEISCAMDDLIIEEVEIKNPTMKQRLNGSAYKAAADAAIIQYIRDELRKSGLESRYIEDKFGSVTLANRLVGLGDVRED